jgi:hypothetical protein
LAPIVGGTNCKAELTTQQSWYKFDVKKSSMILREDDIVLKIVDGNIIMRKRKAFAFEVERRDE